MSNHYWNTAGQQTQQRSGGSGQEFIGIPDDFRGPRAERTVGIPPRPMVGGFADIVAERRTLEPYRTGSEFEIVRWSARSIGEFQLWARSVGLIGPKTKVRRGFADRPTISAFKELMGIANQQGLTVEEAMSEVSRFELEDSGGGGGGGGGASVQVRTVSEDDLSDGIQSGFAATLGRHPSDEELTRFKSAFRDAETRRNQSLQARSTSVQDIPDPRTFAEQRAQDTDEAKVFHGARLMLGLVDSLRGGL